MSFEGILYGFESLEQGFVGILEYDYVGLRVEVAPGLEFEGLQVVTGKLRCSAEAQGLIQLTQRLKHPIFS